MRGKPIPAGFRSGKLTVVRMTDTVSSDNQRMYECLCDCGNTTFVRGQFIRKQMTKSCKCLHRNILGDLTRTHGHTRTPTYYVWVNMKTRCGNPKNESFKHYGARGITVDPSWMKFENFLADMGKKPAGLTLERKDNDKGYSKENCIWADYFEQAANRRPPKKRGSTAFKPTTSLPQRTRVRSIRSRLLNL